MIFATGLLNANARDMRVGRDTPVNQVRIVQ